MHATRLYQLPVRCLRRPRPGFICPASLDSLEPEARDTSVLLPTVAQLCCCCRRLSTRVALEARWSSFRCVV